jgi:hypothetical protein
MRGSRSSVVCRLTSKLRRLRLLMPISGVCSCSARIEFVAVVHFDQHRHAEACGDGLELAHRRQIERGGDQQDGVGAHGARFEDLIGVDQKVLAQHRQAQAARAACRYSGAPWKNWRSVSTDRQAAPCARNRRRSRRGENRRG